MCKSNSKKSIEMKTKLKNKSKVDNFEYFGFDITLK